MNHPLIYSFSTTYNHLTLVSLLSLADADSVLMSGLETLQNPNHKLLYLNAETPPLVCLQFWLLKGSQELKGYSFMASWLDFVYHATKTVMHLQTDKLFLCWTIISIQCVTSHVPDSLAQTLNGCYHWPNKMVIICRCLLVVLQYSPLLPQCDIC